MVSVDVKTKLLELGPLRTQGLCESRGGLPELPVPNSPYGLCGRRTEITRTRTRTPLTSGAVSVKVGVAVLGSPSLIVLMVSVAVKQHCTREKREEEVLATPQPIRAVSPHCFGGYSKREL